MNLTRILPLGALALTALVHADTLTVQATADIYAAGQATLPTSPNPGGFAPFFSLSPGAVSAISIEVSHDTLACDFSVAFTADGNCQGNNDTQITGMNGLSGLMVDGANMFLAGVFLDNSTPGGTGPTDLAYNTGGPGSLNTTGDMFAPLLGQVFFLGDGLSGTGAGMTQTFNVPSTATRLYIGFAGNEAGTPNFDANDTGSLSVTLMPAPEPTTLSMLAGALLVGFSRAARRMRRR